MKKVIKLSKEKLGKIISQIMEQVNLEDYEDEESFNRITCPPSFFYFQYLLV